MPNEALICFTHILEEVPRWIQQFESILETSTRRQLELVTAHQPAQHDPTISRRDSLSDPADLTEINENPATVDGPLTDDMRPLIPHMTTSDALRLSQCKRKTLSVCSGDVSGPSKFRVRSRAIVFFDGDAQKSLEQLVRVVGLARNSIRKGKMSAKVDCFSRTGSSSSESSTSENEDAWTQASKLRLVNAGYPRWRPFAPDDGAEAFDRADKHLAEAQSLCERAAHQMLRSGSCALEVGKAKAQLNQAVTVVEAELPAMRKRAAKAEARRRRSEERHQAAKEAAGAELCEDECIPADPHVIPLDAVFPAESSLEIDEISVDSDSGDETYHFDAIPLGKFPQLRTARRAAY